MLDIFPSVYHNRKQDSSIAAALRDKNARGVFYTAWKNKPIKKGMKLMIAHATLQYPYPYIPVEKRTFLPRHNACSISPATDPSDNYVTGNGAMRINVTGRPYNEYMTFGHELLYVPQWVKTPEPPDLRPVLPEIRRLLREGNPEATDAIIDKAQADAGFGKWMKFDDFSVMPTGSTRKMTPYWIHFDQPKQPNTRNYLRWLDMQNGEIVSIWTNDRGDYKTESFSAYDGNVNVNRLTGPKGKLDVEVTVDIPSMQTRRMGAFFGPKLEGSTYEVKNDEKGFVLSWAYNPEYGKKGWVAVIRYIPVGGQAEKTERGLKLTGADSLMVISRVVPFDKDFSFDCAGPIVQEIMEKEYDFDRMLAFNAKVFGEKMDRSRIHLGAEADYRMSGEELLVRAHGEKTMDPTLLEKLYDLGRFFLIYETGELPPMFGQHNINTNLQVCAGNNTGLFDEMDAYFRYYETKFDDFRTNAKLLFGARGLLASVHCDPDSGLYYHFSHTYPHYCWTGCLGWVYNELWGYWLITGDKKFLAERLLPAYEEMALFFEDYACDKDERGKSIFYPSFSPEDPTPNPDYVTVTSKSINPTRINSVMDIAICREILTNLIDGSKVLGVNQDKIAHWEKQLEDLPVYLTDEQGALKEWAWPTIEENYNHRHVSHHYDVWPGRAVTPETEPELAKAILRSNRKRGQQDDSAHGIIHRAFTAIRLKDMEEMMQNFSQLIDHGFVRRTLFGTHFPYRGTCPDPTGAFPALLIEMAVFSMPGVIEFLPCMPDNLLEKGALDGVWLYTFAKLNHMEWTDEGVKASVTSNEAQKLTLRCRKPGCRIFVNGVECEKDGDHTEYAFKQGETAQIEIRF